MEIHEIKTRISILEVAERLGIRVDKHGKAHCPFHDDKKPSLQFSKEKNIATCFSANCDAGTMDQVSLTEKSLKLSTHEAINQLKEWVGLPAEALAQVGVHENGKPPKPEKRLDKPAPYPKLFQVFKSNLQKSTKAKQYLESRNLSLTDLEVGYNQDTWPQMKECIIFPLKDKSGEIVGLYGRSINSQAEITHLYNKGRKGLYPEYPEPTTKELILTESIIDAATLIPHTSHYVLACYGTNGFTPEHQQAIQGLPELESVTIFFDGDEAGKEGMRRTAELLRQIRPQLKVFYIDTPDGEDINSLAQSHEKEVFTHLLENRQSIDNFFPRNEVGAGSSSENLSAARHEETNQGIIFNAKNPQLLVYQHEGMLISVLGGIGSMYWTGCGSP